MMRPRETPPKPQLCAIYARVSPKPEGVVGDNYSIESQLHEMRALARKKYGCEEPHEFIDRNASGATLDRPELDRLRDNLAQKLYKVVIAYSPDRWTRSDEFDNVILDQELKKGGAELDFVSGGYANTPEGELARDVQNAVSRFERRKFRERARRCRRQKSREKFLHPCRAPDGYEYRGHKFGHRGQYVIVKERAKVIVLIFEKTAAGMTNSEVARYLNERGIKPQKGGRGFHRTSIAQVLEKTAYYGELVQNDEIIKVPAIVSRELWDRAHEALARNKVGRVGRSPRHYLLSGLMWCARCRKARCSTWPSGKNAVYRCNNVDPMNRGIRFCHAPGINKAVIEQAVWNAIWDTVCDPGLLWRVIEAYHDRMAGRPAKKDPAAVRIDRARRMVERAEQILNDPDQPIPYKQAKQQLEAARREFAEAQMMGSAQVAIMPLRKDVTAASAAFRAMREELEAFEDRREAIQLLVAKILYADGKAEIHCHLPAADARNCNRRIGDDCNFSDPVPFVIQCSVTPISRTEVAHKAWATKRATKKRRAA